VVRGGALLCPRKGEGEGLLWTAEAIRGQRHGEGIEGSRPWHEWHRAAQDRHQRHATEGDEEETDRWAWVYLKFNF
jgi:hypothetical protein